MAPSTADGRSSPRLPPKERSEANAAHLARVRENQRRSRARRKEYLNELEDKFRRCEQAGVEASAEMQQVARKVLDENMRLRALLQSKGISEDELNAFTGIEDLSDATSPTEGLETLLNTRKPCCGDDASASPTLCGPLSGTSAPSPAAFQLPSSTQDWNGRSERTSSLPINSLSLNTQQRFSDDNSGKYDTSAQLVSQRFFDSTTAFPGSSDWTTVKQEHPSQSRQRLRDSPLMPFLEDADAQDLLPHDLQQQFMRGIGADTFPTSSNYEQFGQFNSDMKAWSAYDPGWPPNPQTFS